MGKPVKIENIEEMRRRAGIDDVELREEICELEVGDLVRLTLLTSTKSFETVVVRITGIRGYTFRGQLTNKPASAGLARLRVGAPLVFTRAHIHSLLKGPAFDEP